MKKCFQVIQSIKGHLAVITFLFFASMVAGYYLEGPLLAYLSGQLEGLKELKNGVEQQKYPQLALFLLIFINNSVKAVLIMFFGIAFGVIPVFFIIVNGLLIGFLLRLVSDNNQDPVLLVLTGILPHGILEIPAILISAAIGLKLGSLSWRYVIGWIWTEERVASQQQFSYYTSRLWSVAKVLTLTLFVAALIETFITTRIMSLFIS
jgi:stage II sporulation protein M